MTSPAAVSVFVPCATCPGVIAVPWCRDGNIGSYGGLRLRVFAPDVEVAVHEHSDRADHLRPAGRELQVSVPCSLCGVPLPIPATAVPDGHHISLAVDGQLIGRATLRHLNGSDSCRR